MSQSNNIEAMRKALLAWFEANKRAMPWRTLDPRDPYIVAVSEVMLQQTQVTTVLKYYDRWMREFPTWQTLAEAPIEQVLKAWEGMGYYTRARNLHKLAQAVVARGGELPRTATELEKLPGIGPYSSRSIASIAYGEPEACVDGNIVRVLSRLHAIEKSYKSASAAVHDYQRIADELLTREHAGAHNEAMMELGATICIKGTPRCPMCPLREYCKAYKMGIAESLPRLERIKIIPKAVRRIWAVREGHILLQRGGAATGNLHGLWELPTPEAVGVKKLPAKEILKRVRSITKYKITEAIYEIKNTDGIAQRVGVKKARRGQEETYDEQATVLQWVDLYRLDKVPLSGPHAEWIKELLSQKKRRID